MHSTATRIVFTALAALSGVIVGTAAGEASPAEATWRGYSGTMCRNHFDYISNADELGNAIATDIGTGGYMMLYCPAPTISSALSTSSINANVYIYDNTITPYTSDVYCSWSSRVYNSTSGTSTSTLSTTGASPSLQGLVFSGSHAIPRVSIYSTLNLTCTFWANGQYIADYWVDEP